jgi:hypothetical protein
VDLSLAEAWVMAPSRAMVSPAVLGGAVT